MSIGLIIAMVILVLVGGFYIYTASKLGKLNDSARNAAGEVDTYIWDRNHVLEKIIGRAEEKGVAIPEEHKEAIPLALGMLPTMQMTSYTRICKRGNDVLKIVSASPEAAEDEEIKKLMERYSSLRNDIAAAGSRYNVRATTFNAYLSNPLAGFMASRRRWGEKGHFNAAVAEASAGNGSKE